MPLSAKQSHWFSPLQWSMTSLFFLSFVSYLFIVVILNTWVCFKLLDDIMIVSLFLVLYKKTVKLKGCLCSMKRIEFINIQALCHYSSNWHHDLYIYFDFSVSRVWLKCVYLFILIPSQTCILYIGVKWSCIVFTLKNVDNHKIYSCQYTMNLEQWQNTC